MKRPGPTKVWRDILRSLSGRPPPGANPPPNITPNQLAQLSPFVRTFDVQVVLFVCKLYLSHNIINLKTQKSKLHHQKNEGRYLTFFVLKKRIVGGIFEGQYLTKKKTFFEYDNFPSKRLSTPFFFLSAITKYECDNKVILLLFGSYCTHFECDNLLEIPPMWGGFPRGYCLTIQG